MSGDFPRLYAIVDRATLDARGMSVGEFARELRGAGVRLVQYRDKASGAQEVLRASAAIRAAFAGSDCRLILNDRADLAVLAGWDGVHVGQGDLPVEAARRVLEGGNRLPVGMLERKARAEVGVLVGVSTHDEAQMRVAEASGADYVAVGPVFGTATKADAEPVVGLDGVRRARALTAKPLVAIGGITRANARSVVEAGADAVAVIGGLFAEGETVGEVAREFLEILA